MAVGRAGIMAMLRWGTGNHQFSHPSPSGRVQHHSGESASLWLVGQFPPGGCRKMPAGSTLLRPLFPPQYQLCLQQLLLATIPSLASLSQPPQGGAELPGVE